MGGATLWASAGARIPAVTDPGLADQTPEGDDGVDKAGPELDHRRPPLRAASRRAEVVDPGVGAFHRPALADRDRSRSAPPGDPAPQPTGGQLGLGLGLGQGGALDALRAAIDRAWARALVTAGGLGEAAGPGRPAPGRPRRRRSPARSVPTPGTRPRPATRCGGRAAWSLQPNLSLWASFSKATRLGMGGRWQPQGWAIAEARAELSPQRLEDA